MDFEQEKKLVADQWSLSANDYNIFIGFTAGKEGYAFALYPAGAKTLLQSLQKIVTAYEEKNGTIDESLSQIKHMSPFQPKK